MMISGIPSIRTTNVGKRSTFHSHRIPALMSRLNPISKTKCSLLLRNISWTSTIQTNIHSNMYGIFNSKCEWRYWLLGRRIIDFDTRCPPGRCSRFGINSSVIIGHRRANIMKRIGRNMIFRRGSNNLYSFLVPFEVVKSFPSFYYYLYSRILCSQLTWELQEILLIYL